MFRVLLSFVLIFLHCIALSVPAQIPPGFRGGAEISKGKFLVATPTLKDPIFAEAVVRILRYDAKGTIGLMINRPTNATLATAFPDLKKPDPSAGFIYFGGPVAKEQLFLLLHSRKKGGDHVEVLDSLFASIDSKFIEKRIGSEQPKEKIRLFFGCSSWAPGQLEAEILEGNWDLVPAEIRFIFDLDPKQIWEDLRNRTTLRQL